MSHTATLVLEDIPISHTPLSAAMGYSDEVRDLQERYRRFVDEVCIPHEDPALLHDIAAQDALLADLRDIARQRGVFGPMIAKSLGGLELSLRDGAVVLEELGRSYLGPAAVHAGAPDETNIAMLDKLAVGAQRERYLAPLAQASVRSCYA